MPSFPHLDHLLATVPGSVVTNLARAYAQFEERTASARSRGTKQDRVRDYVANHAPNTFRIADIRVALPGISDPTIRLTLDQLKREETIRPDGTGRGAQWVRTSDGNVDPPPRVKG